MNKQSSALPTRAESGTKQQRSAVDWQQTQDMRQPAHVDAARSLPRVYATLAEAAEMMGYRSTKTISRKIRAGELEARGRGKGLRVVYASVLQHPDYRPDGRDA